MIKYYDPMLFTSTPEHPETAGILTVLTEPVDGEILRHAVESLRDRYPYFYVRAEVNGTDLVSVPNPLPMVVRNSLETVPLLSKEANYHWLAFRYSVNTISWQMVRVFFLFLKVFFTAISRRRRARISTRKDSGCRARRHPCLKPEIRFRNWI